MDATVQIAGYDYGSTSLPASPITLAELNSIKLAAGFKDGDPALLRRIGSIMADHWPQYVDGLRQTLAQDRDAAKAARSLDEKPLPFYRDASGARLIQGFRDTCSRPFDQTWLDYQHEIALRHTSQKKNLTDGVVSFPFVPLRYIIAHSACLVEHLRPYLETVETDNNAVHEMLSVWLRATLIQVALMSREYNLPAEW